MKKSSILILIVIVTSLFSCKKKETTPQPSTPTPSNNNSGNSGVFMSRKQVSYNSGNISNVGGFSVAYVSNSTLIDNAPQVGTLLDMGVVNLNGTIFKKNSYNISGYYSDSLSVIFSTPFNWNVSGSSSVSGFTYTNTNPYPVYTGYSSIADTYTISNGITIPLTSYSGSDEIETYFVTTTSPSTNTTVKTIIGSPNSLSFTAAELNTIGATNNVVLVINFIKNNVQTINGKSYNFRTSYGFLRQNITFI